MRKYVAEKSIVVQFLPTKVRVVAPSRSCIVNTEISGGLKTTTYAGLALSEEWNYATCTPSPPEL